MKIKIKFYLNLIILKQFPSLIQPDSQLFFMKYDFAFWAFADNL